MEKEKQTKTNLKKKLLSKPVALTLFYTVCTALAVVIVLHNNPLAPDPVTENLKKICACLLLATACVVFGLFFDKIFVIPKELFQSRELIWKLSKNDFKKRYAGSYLGFVWAMVQPVVTVLMYWIVFDLVFKTRSQMVASGVEVPYVLYLTAGLVPWFYFTEALTNGTNALLEYSYLVKKVVFKISILPIIKIVSALFVHVFFICFMLILFACYGYYPDLYTLQIFYYSFCMFMFILGMSYITCSLIIFFRDLGQMIAIALQVGIWATPILWNLHLLDGHKAVYFIMKLNPMTYIVQGYRASLFDKMWFWENFYSTAYFWILTVVIFGIGALVFKRLKVHFADVL